MTRLWIEPRSPGPLRNTLALNQHHHVVPLARISLTLSRHFSLSFIASGRSSGLHPVSSHSCCMYVRAGRPDFARLYVGVHAIKPNQTYSTRNDKINILNLSKKTSFVKFVLNPHFSVDISNCSLFLITF